MAALAYVFTLFSSSLTAEVQPYTPIIDNGPLPGICRRSQLEITDGNLIKQLVEFNDPLLHYSYFA